MRLWFLVFVFIITPELGLAQTITFPAEIADGEEARLSVSGLQPAAKAEVILRRVQMDGSAAESRSVYIVDANGTLDPASNPSIEGDYQGVDPAGPFWSMKPINVSAPDVGQWTVTVQIDGTEVAKAFSKARELPRDVEFEDVPEFVGARLYKPTGKAPLPVIIVLGGSEGGSRASRSRAARLAGMGYAALALPYYKPSWSNEMLPGLPEAFADIPVERLEVVHNWIEDRPDLDEARIGLYGVSKGGEFALIAATRFEWLRAVAAIVPSDVVWEGWGTGDTSKAASSFAWYGQPLPFVPYIGMKEAINAISRGERRSLLGPHLEGRKNNPDRAASARIPIERFCGALLLAGGDKDMTWASGEMVRSTAERRAEAGRATISLSFANAGHNLSDTGWSPINFPGNDAAANSAAQRVVWQRTRDFFEESLALGADRDPTCQHKPAPVTMAEAAQQYFALNFLWFEQQFDSNSVAHALQRMLLRDPSGPELLTDALAREPSNTTREQLAELALNGFRHRLDFAGLVRAGELLGRKRDKGSAFLAKATPSLSMNGNMIEVDYQDRRISATIGGKSIRMIVDTGAPGVSISRNVVLDQGLALLKGSGANAVIPSLNLTYRLEPVIINELVIGDAVFRSIPAESGDLTSEQQSVLVQNGLASEMIVGLDFFARFFDVVEFDQIDGKLRLYRVDTAPAAQPNFVMGAMRYPLVSVDIGGSDRTVILDTGSGNNNLPPHWLSNLACDGYREFTRDWGKFGEYLIPLKFEAAGGEVKFWVSARDFGEDETFGARGVLGAINRGRLRIDLADANITWSDYDPAKANYDFAPDRQIDSDCPGL